jgi:trimeric autotransporter adhesin
MKHFTHFFERIFVLGAMLLLFAVIPTQIQAQISQGGTPMSFSPVKGLNGVTEVTYDELVLRAPDVEQLRVEDVQSGKDGTPLRVGVSMPIIANRNSAGNWTDLPDGGRLWTLKIHAAGATALSVFFDQWRLAPGCSMFFYNENRKHVIGSFTHKNNLENGTFATEMVQGENLYIEYYEPKYVSGQSYFNIASVGYFYEELIGLSGYKDDAAAKAVGASDACEVNINCSPVGDNWQDEKRGVAQITLLSGGSWYVCTGSLVNNTAYDATPYFLTAYHCGAEGASAAELNQWVFKFRYEAVGCTNPGGEPATNSITGCVARAEGNISGGSDFFLVQLNSTPTAVFQPYYNGWDRTGATTPTGVGIHHPAGDIKKISTYGSIANSGNNNISGDIMAANSSFVVGWVENANGWGVTEGGSSGSPLFNSNGLQIGTLTGGSSFCTNQTATDIYGRFSYHWLSNGPTNADRLQPWLDPAGTTTTLPGYDPFATQPPIVEFEGSPTTILQGGSVDFYNYTTNSPTSHSWTFENGTPGTSTDINPAGIVYNVIGTHDVTLTSSNTNGPSTLTKTDYIEVIDPASSFCDTLSQFCCNPIIYTSAAGYVGGTNEYDCLAVAEYFATHNPYNQITGMRIYLAAANNGTNPNVSFVLWDNANGSPTNQLATVSVPMAQVVTAFNGDGYIDINFASTITLPAGGFYTGFLVPGTPASGDTLAVLTNDDADNGFDTGYSLYGTSWETYAAWGLSLQNAIFPFMCYDGSLPPVADFVGVPTRIPIGSTVQFTDMSVGTPATSWAWTFSNGTPGTSSVENPLITYSTIGVFDVSLTISNANGTDTETKVGYIEVYDPNSTNAFSLDFEACTDFQLGNFAPWTTLDVDNMATWGVAAFDFPNEGYTGSYIAFNSNNTTPPADPVWDAHGGNLCGIVMAANPGPNNDWLMSTQITLGTNSSFKFWAKSLTNQYGLERFRVLVSTTTNAPASFTLISAGTYVEAPLAWTEYTYNLTAYDGDVVYIAVQCVSNDAFAFMIDDIEIITTYPPPVADFVANQTNVEQGATVNFTDISTASPTSWVWSFPGGTPATSTAQNPSIVYNTIGTYEVSLTVTNSTSSDTETKTGYITVTPASLVIVEWNFPTASADQWSDAGIPANLGNRALSLVGATTLTYPVGGATTNCASSVSWQYVANTKWWQVSFTTLNHNTLRLWSKQTGDANRSPRDFKVQYSLNGTTWTDVPSANVTCALSNWNSTGNLVGISLPAACENQTLVYLRWLQTSDFTIANGNNIQATQNNKIDDIIVRGVPMNVAPVANFTASATTICAGQSVTFTDASTGTPTSWAWSFAGGTPATSTNQNPVITYNTAGTYTVELTATNANGSDVETKASYITVNALPTAPTSVAATQTTICAGANTTLSYTGGSGTTFNWYTGSCGGVSAGTGNNLVVTPATTTTYYGRWENTCGQSVCQSITITVNPLPVAPTSATATLPTICSGQSTTLSYVGGSGTTFNWYTASCGGTLVGSGNNLSVSPTVTTTYYGRWENTCGNSTCQTVTITVNPLPVAPTSVAATLTTTCAGQTTSLSYTGGSGTTFRWYTGDCGTTLAGTGNNLNVTPTVTTTYYGRWENSCGNSTCQTITITVNPLAVAATSASASVPTICQGQSSVLSYVGGSGTTFNWYTASCGGTLVGSGNNLSVSPTATTTYYGRWENSCGNSTCVTTTVTVNPLPVAPTSATATIPTICSGQSTTLSYVGGSGTTFRWYTGACGTTLAGAGNNLSVSPTVTTTYYGRWENSCGNSTCATVTITVNPLAVAPTSVAATQTTICEGQSSVLSYVGGTGTTFRWYTGSCGGTLVGSGNNLSVSPTSTTTYYGAWENSCGLSGCATVTITVNPLPVAPTSASATATTICNGQSTTLSYIGGSGTVFRWYTGSCTGTLVGSGNDLVVSPTATTTYYGAWENSCGFSACATVTITVNPLAVIATSVSATQTTICSGQSTVLSYVGGSGTTFRWYTGSCGGTLAGSGNDLSVSPTTTTTYYGAWENSCGISTCRTITITVNPLPVVATSVSATATTICEGQSSVLSYVGGSGTTFGWYTASCGGTSVGSGNNLSVSPTTTTTYYGRWENTCGTSACQSVTITVNPLPIAATSASASVPTICEGQSSVLSYIGGTGTTFNWYTASCGGTLVGSGNNLSVSPITTTTYYGRWENTCGTSACVTTTVTVNPLAVAATSVSATQSIICSGATTSLSYVGGSGTNFRWYTDGCGTTLAGSGNNLNVSPTVTTTYYGRWENSCGNSVCQTITITVNPLPVIATSVSATSTTICNGQSTDLTYIGGSGSTFNWYTGSCGGALIGTGNNLTVSPSTTTTYYGAWENSCGVSTCRTVTITVNPLAVEATTVSASATTICFGESSTLSYAGGTGATFRWYTGSCGGVLAGSGNNLVVSPTTTTTYYGAWENSCGLSACKTVTVNVTPLPATPITNVDCTGGENFAVVTVTSPVGAGFEYSLNGGAFQSSPIFVDLANGSYNITVRSNSCTFTGSNFNVNCGCFSPTELTLTSNVGSTCGITPITVLNNTFGGSATEVNVIHNGSGTITSSYVTSPFNFTYTPAPADAGNTVQITFTTNNPAGLPCLPAQDVYTLTVNPLAVAPTSATASHLVVCPGASSSLSYVGGNGTTFKWYTDACNSTFIGSGNNFSVNPLTTTTYYGSWENSCGSSTCAQVTVTVTPLPQNVTSVASSPSIICNGESSTLSYVGGSGSNYIWYTASCGGAVVGSGNDLLVSPTTNTTYYGRWENSCGVSDCEILTITVNQLPVAATSASASISTICEGQSSVLTYVGGSGTTFNWYTASCGGTLAGSGNSLSVSPTTTTTYYGRWENSCGTSACQTVTITVNPLAVAATSVSATQTTICSGASTTLSYIGGSGTTFNWYTASCGGALVGSGNNLSVSPTVTTTYYGRWENSCGSSACQTVTITVNPLTVAPSAANASLATICAGQTTILSYTGGSGTTFRWYTGACGTTLAGTGNDLSVSPTVTTTYYGRWENSCGNSACQSVTVTVNPIAVAPTSVSASLSTICNGGNTTLSYVGGSGDTFRWFTGSCGGTLAGTGNDLVVSPTVTTTYYGAWENTCGLTVCESITITVNQLPVAPTSVQASIATICFGGNSVLTYTGGSGTIFNWYTGSCGGSIIGSGNNLIVNPTVTTTYYGRWENSCGLSVCESVTVVVNPLAIAPVSVAASPTTVNPTESSVLSFVGGVGTTFNWYTGSCGGTLIGTGNDFSVTPTGTITYYGAWENSCGVSTCLPVTVSLNALPVAPDAVSATNTTICAGSGTTISYTGGNGSVFKWYTVDCGDTEVGEGNDLFVNPLVTTTYYGRWENAFGNSTCESITITVNPLPVAATLVSVDNSTICAGEAIVLSYTGGSGDTFRWFENACGTSLVGTGNNLSLSPSVTTTYYGYWENACGVSLCEFVTVTVNPLPVAAASVSVSDANVCAGSAVTLSYVGGNGAMFRWYANDCGTTLVGEGNDLIVNPSVTTVYYGRWENTCGTSICQTVTVNVEPIPVAPTVIAATNTVFCEGQSTILIYAGGVSGTMNWYENACGTDLVGTGNNLLVSPTVTTTYFGRFESSCGMSDCGQITITVNQQPVAASSVFADNASICSGSAVTLDYIGGNGEFFNWYSDACGTTLVGEGSELVLYPTVSTSYFGRWENSCGESVCQQVDVVVNDAPQTPVASFECSTIDESATITISEPLGIEYTYSIDGVTFQADPVFTNVVDGVYTVFVEMSGCVSSSISVLDINCVCDDQATITLPLQDGVMCINEAVYSVGGNTFSGSTTELIITHDGNGTIQETVITSSPFEFAYIPGIGDGGTVVTITITSNDTEGAPCTVAIENFMLTVEHAPVIDLPETIPACVNEVFSYELTETYDYVEWSNGSTETTFEMTYAFEGEYQVWVIVGNTNCEATDTMIVVVDICENVDITDSEQFIGLYPNPANELSNLIIKGYTGEISYVLVDAQGKEIVAKTIGVNSDYSEELDLESLVPGMYFVRVTTDTEVANLKLIRK